MLLSRRGTTTPVKARGAMSHYFHIVMKGVSVFFFYFVYRILRFSFLFLFLFVFLTFYDSNFQKGKREHAVRVLKIGFI